MTKPHAVSVSNYQFCLLSEAGKRGGGLSLSRILEIKQTTGGSLVRRGLLRWNERLKVFALTDSGLSILEIYKDSDLERKNQAAPLSKFIAPKVGTKAALREVKRVRASVRSAA